MPQRKNQDVPPEVPADDEKKIKTATCQLAADVVYWATVVGAIERISLAKMLDPMIREYVRARVVANGLDPDALLSEHLKKEREKRVRASGRG